MRKDKMRRRLVVGALAAALGVSVVGAAVVQKQEVDWASPATSSATTSGSETTTTPATPTGREESREADWG